jgi:uncharacterized protein (TIGR00645 family)
MQKSNMIESIIENGLFASRWFMAPFYLGLAIALGGLTYSFVMELWHFIFHISSATSTDVILGALSLIDLSLAGNLILIVIFSGYENFVSKLDVTSHKYQPDWKGSVDFNTLKLKLISSIVAISGIHLLKIFMSDSSINTASFRWLLITHLLFVLSGVFLAIMDFISAHTQAKKAKKDLK